jgi:hypothetical protein
MKTKTHFAFRVATGSSAGQDISNRTVRAGRVHRALGSRGFFFSEIGSGGTPHPPDRGAGEVAQDLLPSFNWDPKSRLGVLLGGTPPKNRDPQSASGDPFLGARDQL